SPAGLGLSLNPSSVSLSPGGSGATTLTISTQSSTPAGSYTVTVTGSSGALSHSTSIQVSVVRTAQPDFSISANPASITLQRGASASSTVTVTSLNGFGGTVALTDSISPATSNPPVISLSSSSLTLSSGGSAGSILTIATTSSTTSGSYTVLVTGTSGSLSHSDSQLQYNRQLYSNRYRNEWIARALRFYPRHRIRLLYLYQPVVPESATGDIRNQPDHRYEPERVHWYHKPLSNSLTDVRSKDV